MKAIYSNYLSSLTSNQVFYIDCSASETGTHKDLRSKAIVEYVIKNGISSIHLITSGNAGISLKHAIEKVGRKIKLVNLMPLTIQDDITGSLVSGQSQVVKVDLSREFLSGEKIRKIVGDKSFDATYIEGLHYAPLIQSALTVLPDYVLMPLGSGELFNSFYQYSKDNSYKVKLSGVIPEGAHPLSLRGTQEKTLADKLSCPFIHPAAREKVNEAHLEGHILYEVNNKTISENMALAKSMGIETEPSAAVSLAPLKEFNSKRIVCIITGRGKIAK